MNTSLAKSIFGFLLIVMAASGLWLTWPRSPLVRAASSGDELPAPRGLFRYEGAMSCAAAACHNRQGARGSKGSEYTTWMSDDFHSRAFAVLADERSLLIEKNLKGLGRLKDAHPEKNRLCLNCHVGPDLENAQDHEHGRQEDLVQDGVGCESCHGPAEKWRSIHYLRTWQNKSDREKEALGFHPLKDLMSRATLCTGCHIGSGERDVNHDLIAAGHPRLNFEYAAYLAILPRHWSIRDEKARDPDYEARVWVLGQVASAQAALDLLKHRARTSKQNPWPEFAEYDCFACHHHLQARSWRQERDVQLPTANDPDQTRLTPLPWGSWYFSGALATLAGRPGSSDQPSAPIALQRLRQEMKKAAPDRNKVEQQAAAAAEQFAQLGRRLAGTRYNDPGWLREHLLTLAQDGQKLEHASWDEATQRYLGLVSLYRRLQEVEGGRADPRMAKALRATVTTLRFPPHSDSPESYDPQKFIKELRLLQDSLHP